MANVRKIEARQKEIKKLRVAAYARVSTSSEEQLLSLSTQKMHYETYIKQNENWEYAGLYFDEGISGTKLTKRTGLEKLISDCENGLIDYILVKSISRFSRNTLDCVSLVRKFNALGIHLFFEKENIDTSTMDGELMLSILSSLAEDESRSHSNNLKWSNKQRFKDGTYKISYTAYGYKNNENGLVIDEEEAEVVRLIFNRILNGSSTIEIANELNNMKLVSKRGNKWSDSTIRGMIKNEVYVGDLILQKTYSDDFFKKHTNKGEREFVIIEDNHSPIVTRDEFEKANRIIKIAGNEKGICLDDVEKYKSRYVFSGKLECGYCGNHYLRRHINNRIEYVCKTHIKEIDKCQMRAVPGTNIENAFINMLNKLRFAKRKVLYPYQNYAKGRSKESVRENCRDCDEKLEEIMNKQINLMVHHKNGILDTNFYNNEIMTLRDEQDKLKIEKERLELEISKVEYIKNETNLLVKYIDSSENNYKFDGDIFEKYVEKVIINARDEVTFVMKCGLDLKERM